MLKEIGSCAAKEQASKPRIGTSRAIRRSLPMSRFGFDEAVDLALAGGALLRFENVLEIDFQPVSGSIWVIIGHSKTPPQKGFEHLVSSFETEVDLTSSGTASRIAFEVRYGAPAEAAMCPDLPSESVPGLSYGGQRERISSF